MRRHRLAGDLDHRVITRADRHRHRPQHAHAQAGRGVGFFQRIAVLQGVGEHGRALGRTAVVRAHHIEADLQVRITGLLEALVAVDLAALTGGDDVALAEQGAPGGLARARLADRKAAREGARVVEILVFVDRGLFRGTAGNTRQHKGQPERTEDG